MYNLYNTVHLLSPQNNSTHSHLCLNLVLSLSLSHTGHWKFNMAPHGKELSEDLKKRIVFLHKDGVGYRKIPKTLKLSCSTVAKTILWFNRTGSTQNRPRHGRPKKLSAPAQHHIQRLYERNCHLNITPLKIPRFRSLAPRVYDTEKHNIFQKEELIL